MTTKKRRGELPTAIEAKWAKAALEPGVPVDMGDVVVCDLCAKDYRGDPETGGLIFRSTAVGPCCVDRFETGLRDEDRVVHCPEDVSFHAFVLGYRLERGADAICIHELSDVNKLREYVGEAPPEVVPGDGWDEVNDEQKLAQARREMNAGIDEKFVSSSDHPYTCPCDDCLTWWAKMGPDDDAYGPFLKERVNERQRELGLEET